MKVIFTQKHELHTTDGFVLPSVTADEPMREVPARAEKIVSAAVDIGLGPVLEPVDFGMEPILAVHDSGYVDYLRAAYDTSLSLSQAEVPVLPETFPVRSISRVPSSFFGQKGYYCLDTLSPIFAGTWEAAYWSAQCALAGADILRKGEPMAYAICRPPGHHAAADLSGGHCYLNNVAVAARYLAQTGRVAILDIDFHHGNGTQAIFYDEPEIFFCSLHGSPTFAYPYLWGYEDERGEGAGEGYTLNVPLPSGMGDDEYVEALEGALLKIDGFQPDYLLISLGFDIGAADPYGGFEITPHGFTRIAAQISSLNVPTLLVQEGGYLLETLANNAQAFLQGL